MLITMLPLLGMFTSLIGVPSAEADSVFVTTSRALTCRAIYIPPLRGWSTAGSSDDVDA
jgi:hypothetical protein